MIPVRHKSPVTRALILFPMVVMMAACSKKDVYVDRKEPPVPSLLQYIQNNFSLTIYYAALKKTGLDKTLEEGGPFTLFIPDNDAFKTIGVQTPADVDRMNADSLKKALEYHILPQKILYEDIPQALDNEYKNLAGNVLYISKDILNKYPDATPNPGHVNGVPFKFLNVAAKNGVAHILYSPLRPPAPSVQAVLDADTTLSCMVAALKKFGLYDQLSGEGPITVLAVSNTAFRIMNISLDSISRMDTARLNSYLFSVYVLRSRLFLSHFYDAPGVGYGPDGLGNYVYSKDGFLSMRRQSYFNPRNPPYMMAYAQAYGYGADRWSLNYIGGYSSATFTAWDYTAVNGVVHVLDKLIIYPNFMNK